LEALEFDVGGAEVGEVVVGLLGEPGFGSTAEDFGEADGHFGAWSTAVGFLFASKGVFP
jgi:hypothetical protein